MNNVQKLDIAGARDTVEIDGVMGVFYKIRVAGEVVKRRGGGWEIPMAKGDSARLTSRGFIPGFQTLSVNGDPVYAIGAHVPTPLRALIFLPFLLIALNPILGFILGFLLFFMNVSLVKNPLMPYAVRVAMPLVNTVAGGVLLYLMAGLVSR